MRCRHADAAVTARNAESLTGVFLPGRCMDADCFVSADAHRVRHAVDHVGAPAHRCGSVFGVDLAVEDRRWS